MNINSVNNSAQLANLQFESNISSSPNNLSTTPQALASASQSRSQESAAQIKETQTQQRVQARDEAQASSSSNAAFEQYLQTGKLDTYA